MVLSVGVRVMKLGLSASVLAQAYNSFRYPYQTWFGLLNPISETSAASFESQPFVKSYEHVQYVLVLVKFVVKLSYYFRGVFSIIKLALDARSL